jgi:hypothetical protein
MATEYPTYTFDYISLFDNTFITGEYKTSGDGEAFFTDQTSAFFIFKSIQSPDITSFYDNTILECEIYLNKILDENFGVYDSAFARGIYTAITFDTVEFSDTTSSTLNTTGEKTDSIIYRTKSKGYITYPTQQDDEASFYDSCISLISTPIDYDFKNSIKSLVGTTEEILYAVSSPTKESTVINLSLCNRILSDIKVDVIMNIDGTDTYLMKDLDIPRGESFVINNSTEASLEFKPGDNLRVVADTDNSLDAYAAIMEKNIR